MSNRIIPGDVVLVTYPAGEQTNNPAHALNGQEYVVKTRRNIDRRGGDRVIYELCGAVSKAGIPYSFLTDELIKL